MPTRPLLATPFLIVQHDAAHACLRANWQFRPRASTPLLSYQHILLGVQQTQSTKLCNDCLAVGSGWQEVAAWLAHDCFAQLAQAGVHIIAWVLPPATSRESRTRRLLRNVSCLLVETFTDSAAAQQWLHKW